MEYNDDIADENVSTANLLWRIEKLEETIRILSRALWTLYCADELHQSDKEYLRNCDQPIEVNDND